MKKHLILKNWPHDRECTFALRALQLNGNEAPAEFPLLMPGTWNGYVRAGKQRSFTITVDDLVAAAEYNKRRKERNPGRDLVLDYEHQTLTGEIAPAAGWFDLEVRDGVLYAVNVRWTAKAKEMVEAGEYRYVSPVFKHRAVDKLTGQEIRMMVANAALTNEPFLDELPPLVSAKDVDVQLFILSQNTKEVGMNPIMQFLLTFFGLPEDTSESTILDKLKEALDGIPAKDLFTLKTFRENYSVVAKALGETESALPEKLTALIAARHDMSNYVLKSDYTALKQRLDEREVDELIAENMRLGKISPATKDTFRTLALKDRASFNELMSKTAEFSIVPLKDIETGSVATRNDGGLTETDLLIAKNMGVDVEKLKTTAKALQN